MCVKRGGTSYPNENVFRTQPFEQAAIPKTGAEPTIFNFVPKNPDRTCHRKSKYPVQRHASEGRR